MGTSSGRLEHWLSLLKAQGASDLYLVDGVPPSMRVHGVVRPLPETPLEGDESENMVLEALPPHAVESYQSRGYADAALRRGTAGRLRVNLHRECGLSAASVRSVT